MADVDAGTVKVKFDGDAGGLQSAIQSARSGLAALSGSSKSTQGAISAMDVAVGTAAGTLGIEFAKMALNAAVSVASFASNVTKAASKSVESMDLIAQSVGMTSIQFEQLQPVFARNNVNIEQMGGIFRVLARNIEQAKDPTSQAGKAFDQLGISLTGLESPSEVFTLIADRISKLPDGFQKTRLETELLGRSALQLNGVLSQGAEGFKQSADEAAKMGNVLSGDARKALLDVNDSFDNLDTAQANLSKHLGVLFAPMIQGLNEAKLAVVNWATGIVDEITIATRTLAIRFEALFGFLKAQAQLSLSEMGKIPEIFERWNTWATEQIEVARKLGVSQKDVAGGIGEIDEAAQKAARAAAKVFTDMDFALVKMDVSMRIAEAAAQRLERSMEGQQALGQTIITQTQDLLKYRKNAADFALASVRDQVTQEESLQAAYEQTEAAYRSARQASGQTTGSDNAVAQANASIAAINRQIAAQITLAEAEEVAYNAQVAHLTSQNAMLSELSATYERYAAKKLEMDNRLQVLEANKRTAQIQGHAAVTQALTNENAVRLQAASDIAGAELAYAQASFAGTAELRSRRLAQIQADADRQLAVVGLTEDQKTAIFRNAEAQRMGIAQQFPTFFQKQMQDLVASNAFSLSQITTNFTNATAQWIVTGKGFDQFWKQLQITLVQSFLNSLIQMFAQWVLHTAAVEAATVGLESAKTTIFGAGEASRLAIAKGTNAVLGVMMIASLGAMSATASAALAMAFAVSQIVATIAYGAAAIMAVVPFGQAAAGALIVATTGFEVATAGSLALGAGAIQTAMGAAIVAGAISGAGFAEGGISFGPAIFGEAGPEAAIPLNERGASFMSEMLGLSGGAGQGGMQTIEIYLDGKVIAQHTSQWIQRKVYLAGIS